MSIIKTAVAALVATSALAVLAPTQSAADAYNSPGHGGNCCADLEERVAELEATTVRKGNKKVSLKLSGHLNKGILFWDDGDKSSVYIVDNDHSSSRFRLDGKAKIWSRWEAGFRIEVGVEPGESSDVDQFQVSEFGQIDTRKSYLYLEHETYGRLTLGLDDSATKNITKEDAAEIGYVLTPDFDNARSFLLRPKGFDGIAPLRIANTELGDISGCYGEDSTEAFDCAARITEVKYTSREFGGFYLEAAYGQDEDIRDVWDVALKLDKEYGNLKVKGGIGYVSWREDDQFFDDPGDADRDEVLGSISAWHTTSGLFGLFAAVHSELNDSATTGAGVLSGAGFPEGESYHFQGGIKKKWWSPGHTAVFGYYDHIEDLLGGFTRNQTRDVTGRYGPFLPVDAGIVELTGAEVEGYGFGFAQDFDAAALNLYALFSWYDAEVDLLTANLGATKLEFDDLFTGIVGGRISF